MRRVTPRWLSTISYPTRTRGIMVNYTLLPYYSSIHLFIHSYILSETVHVTEQKFSYRK